MVRFHGEPLISLVSMLAPRNRLRLELDCLEFTASPAMALNENLLASIEEMIAPIGPISVRRMFGGAGLFADGAMFALIPGDGLYFKVDDATRAAYLAEGAQPFRYETKAGTREIASFCSVPERLYDEPEEFRQWAKTAIAVARRSDLAKAHKAANRNRKTALPGKS